MVDDDDPAIGQSGAGAANAGPEASARDKASTIKANRRRIVFQVMQAALTCNYGSRTFVYRGFAYPSAKEVMELSVTAN